MKLKAIKFFSPEENVLKTKVASKVAPLPTGYISNSGKLVFPAATLRDLGIDPESAYFKIGSQEAKRKIKSLYLITAANSDQTFSFEKSGRGHVIPLSGILKKAELILKVKS
ncbi:hypothetical protein [Dyadobacter sp. 676]|uniref:AbrB/MazE/SpoVT family DNA-binding domain-containing protein n=1 Tax=Dyadobacter sp. 676 TaxID=3088362 RepID=A0AAU8FJY1_9BACT